MTAALPTPDPAVRGAGIDPRRLVAALDAAVVFYRTALSTADGPRAYLHGRGLGALVQREWPWRVGYAPPGWNTLTRHLRSAGFTRDELVGAGLSTRTRDDPDRLIDVFRDRVTFPVRSPSGYVVGFIGRASPQASTADTPKYLNTPETAIYTKGGLLFGVAEQQDRLAAGWTPVLVEGPADALAVWLSYSSSGGRAGAAALAPCGTALTDTQAAILHTVPGARHGVIAAFDGDPAGHAAVERAWQVLRQATPAGPLYAARFDAGADPADLLRRPNGRAQLRAALRQTRPLLDTVVEHRLDRMLTRHSKLLTEIPGQVAAVHALVPLLFDATNQAEAIRISELIARRTGTGPETVAWAAVARVETTLREVEADLTDASRNLLAQFRPDGGDAARPTAAAAFPRPISVTATRWIRASARDGDHPTRPAPAVRRGH
jgi:DNA primase catalytic core